MHQPHIYFMLWAHQGLWIFQCPITLQRCICQVLWVKQSQVQTLSQSFTLQSPNIPFVSLELSTLHFLPDQAISMLGPWRHHEVKFDKGEKWLAGKVFFSPQSILLLPEPSHYFLTLLVTLLLLLFYHSPSLSFFHCHIEPSLSCLSPFILSSLWCLLSLYLSCSLSSIFLLLLLCPSWTIYQERHPFTFLPVSFQHRF